jgi:hypothetical protein
MARRVEVATVPESLSDQDGTADRRVDLSFSVSNDGGDELQLVAIEQDVYGRGHGLLRRRRVDESTRIGPGERRTVGNPIAWRPLRIPLAMLVYTFTFRTAAGELPPLSISVSPTVAVTSVGG